jgi:magnesium transporter
VSPSILVRKNSILVNLLHIRALVKADKVLVFDVMNGGDSHAQSIFMWDLEGKLRQGSKAMGGLPYELRSPLTWLGVNVRALESILISVTTALDVEMAVLRKFVNELLNQLEEDIDRERLRNMLVYSKKLSAFEKKATTIRDALAEILNNGPPRADNR